MNRDEFARAVSVFEEACRLEPQARSVFLDAECLGNAELRDTVESMLRHDHGVESEGDPLVGAGRVVLAGAVGPLTTGRRNGGGTVGTSWVGKQIGRYRIVGVLGAGGMGTVFEAQQEQPARRVALKVLSAALCSRELMRRFEFEAEVLGRLQHPGIAQIYDAGTLDGEFVGRPYFVMELIDGEPLSAYARRQRMSMRARLELFAQICRAVEHAHQKGIVHRDLKPGNILVDNAGRPKILDFGVARSMDADAQGNTLRTAPGQLIGTLAYMCPEQIVGGAGSIDLRADVYALGVILFELLAERLPFDLSKRSIPDAARIITEQDPPSMGTINRTFRGDIETIVAKALEKDTERRYASAAALAADIERYLRSEPILARPTTTFYQIGKFARRNKPLVAGVAVAFAALVLGVVFTTTQWQRAVRAERQSAIRLAETSDARDQAEDSAARAGRISRFLQSTLGLADPNIRGGEELSVRMMLDDAARRMEVELSDDPAVEASLRLTVGQGYRRLGMVAQAETQLRTALDLRQALEGDKRREVAEAQYDLAELLRIQGNFTQAEQLLEQVLALPNTVLPGEDDIRIQSINTLGHVRYKQGRLDEAERLFGEAVRLRREVAGESDNRTLLYMNNLGTTWKAQGKLDEAEELLRRTLALRHQLNPDKHTTVAQVLQNLASVLKDKNLLDEAESLHREALAMYRSLLPMTHPDVLTAMNNLGAVLLAKGDYAGAEPIALETLSVKRGLYGEQHPTVAAALHNLGVLQDAKGDYAHAEENLSAALAMRERLLGAGHLRTAGTQSALAKLYMKQQRYAEAEPLFLTAHDTFLSHLGPDHRHTANAATDLAKLYEAQNRPDEAARWTAVRGSRADN